MTQKHSRSALAAIRVSITAMTTVLVPTMQVTGDKKEEKTLDLTVEADGIYSYRFPCDFSSYVGILIHQSVYGS